MPLRDIVVDTNVWVHAQTPGQKTFGRSIRFCRELLSCKTRIRVDRGFDLDEARNRSLIGGEYHQQLRPKNNPGKLAVETLALLFRSNRVRETPIGIERGRKRLLERMVNDPRDRTFVRVAFNSADRVLVTHDHVDFSPIARTTLHKRLGVTFVDAGDGKSLLHSK